MPIAERKREEGENAEEQSYTYYEQCKTPAGWLKLGTVNALFPSTFYIKFLNLCSSFLKYCVHIFLQVTVCTLDLTKTDRT